MGRCDAGGRVYCLVFFVVGVLEVGKYFVGDDQAAVGAI